MKLIIRPICVCADCGWAVVDCSRHTAGLRLGQAVIKCGNPQCQHYAKTFLITLPTIEAESWSHPVAQPAPVE